VVIVSVVVTGSSVPWHEQHNIPVLSFAQLWHLKDPPCATQAPAFLSISHVDSDDVDGAGIVVVAGGSVGTCVGGVGAGVGEGVGGGVGTGVGFGDPGTH